MNLKQIWMICLLSGFCFLLSCDRKNEENPSEVFYGEGSKVWRASKATNEAGRREKLTDIEKMDVLRFNSDGTYSINSAEGNVEGQWVYEPEVQMLSLQPMGVPVSQSFAVENLRNNQMTLKADDGSTLTLQTE